MNTLEAYKLNFQTVYSNQNHSVTCALNLLEFSRWHLELAYKYKNILALKEISENCLNGKELQVDILEEFTRNNLLDNIKISICFENLFKGILLSEWYLVHEIDKNKFHDLYNLQKTKPIKVEELLKITSWKTNRIIGSDKKEYDLHKIEGIKNFTINYSTILENKGYIDFLKQRKIINDEILDILKTSNKERNKLHFNISASDIFNENSYSNFKLLFDFAIEKIDYSKKLMQDFCKLEGQDKEFKFIIKKYPKQN